MSPSLPGSQNQNDQRKWAVAAALALVLVAIVLFRSDEHAGDLDGRSAVAPHTADIAKPDQPEIPSTPSDDDETSSVSWPDWELTELVKFDPFKLSTQLAFHLNSAKRLGQDAADAELQLSEQRANERRERLERVLSELMTKQISAVFTSEKGRSALLGSQWVSEGDVLDGVRVVKIDTGGITVEIAEEPAATGRTPPEHLPPTPADPRLVP